MPLLWSCWGFLSHIICSPKYCCYSVRSLGITPLTEHLNIFKKGDRVVFQESPQKPPEGHMTSIEKAEWEQVRHIKGFQQLQSTGESWEPFIRLTGLPGSERELLSPLCSLETPWKSWWGFLPTLWVMHTYEAWNQTGTWLKCFQHRICKKMLGANSVARRHSQDKPEKFG